MDKIDYIENLLLNKNMDIIDLDEIRNYFKKDNEVEQKQDITEEHYNKTISDMDILINKLRETNKLAKKLKEDTKINKETETDAFEGNEKNYLDNKRQLERIERLLSGNDVDLYQNNNTDDHFEKEKVNEQSYSNESDEETDKQIIDLQSQLLLHKYKMAIINNEFHLLDDNFNNENYDNDEEINDDINDKLYEDEQDENLDNYEVATSEGMRNMALLNNMENLLAKLNLELKAAENLSSAIEFIQNEDDQIEKIEITNIESNT